jgi:signal peptidase I
VTQPESHPEYGQQAPTDEVRWGRIFLDLIEMIVLAIVLFIGINAVSARVRVDGISMFPTLQNGEFVLVNRLAYQMGEVQRSDIIVFEYPKDPSQDLIKRVIGLPGDEIVIEAGKVIVNGAALDEPYIAAPPEYSGTWQVPEGYLFVLGDNRNDSSDSHSWGLLPLSNVIGKAVLIYWPPPQWTVIQHSGVLFVSKEVA